MLSVSADSHCQKLIKCVLYKCRFYRISVENRVELSEDAWTARWRPHVCRVQHAGVFQRSEEFSTRCLAQEMLPMRLVQFMFASVMFAQINTVSV